MVTDQGHFLSGTLDLADGAPAGLSGAQIDIIRNSSGNPLPNKFSSDSEAIEVVIRNGQPAAMRVGFENLSRIADFDLSGGRPFGPAREIAVPQWLTDLRTNESIEAVCIAPPASPVAGSTLVIAESHQRASGQWAATLLGNTDRGDLGLQTAPGVNPTDCAFLPNGDLLVVERGLALLSFSMQIRCAPAPQWMARSSFRVRAAPWTILRDWACAPCPTVKPASPSSPTTISMPSSAPCCWISRYPINGVLS